MDIGIFRCRRSTILWSLGWVYEHPGEWAKQNSGGNRRPAANHKLAKQEVKSLIVIIIVFLWGVHKGGSIVGVCWPVRTVLPPTPTEDRPIQVGSIYS